MSSAKKPTGKKKPPSENDLWSPVKVSKPKPSRAPQRKPITSASGTGQASVIDPNISPLEQAMQKNWKRAMNALQGTPGSKRRVASRNQTRGN